MEAPPRIWTLLGHRRGDNNQVLALAEALKLPFETRTLQYNLLRALEGDYLGATLASVASHARKFLRPPWPDLIIAIGRRSVPVARYVRAKSGRRTRLVLIGHPRVDPRDFDLVITTPQYPVPKHDNVLLLTLAMAREQAALVPEPSEADWFAELPRPHLLFAIGGPTKYYDLPQASMVDSARRIAARADGCGGTLIVAGSPRTDKSALDEIETLLAGSRHRLVRGSRPRFQLLLKDADEIFVTADSMSMLSEAIYTGAPVGMVPVELNATGRKWLGEEAGLGRGEGRRRDLSRVWRALEEQGLVGSIDDPRSSKVANPVQEAAERVRQLLGSGV